MKTYRPNALAAGVLFIIATLASVAGGAIAKPVLGDPDYLARIAADETPVFLGALLRFIAAAASPGIALALYPVLRTYREGLALGSVVFRIVEGTFYAVSVVGTLLLVSLSLEAVASGDPGSAYFRHSGALLLAGCDWMGFVAGVLFFGLGALLYYAALYRSALIPRWLSGWGIASAVLAMVAAVAVLVHLTSPMSNVHLALNLPFFAQELVLAAWLIARGFSPRAIAAATPAPASLAA
jgi:hypothetical protein